MSSGASSAPPEGDLIRTARDAKGMTVTAAAAATKADGAKGVGATYWGDVERGYGGRRGERVQVRASGRALAAMARVVGVTPAQLTAVGRGDAARILEEILRRERPASAPPALPQPLFAEDGQFSLFKQLPRTLVDQIWPDYLLIAGRAEAAAAAHEGLVPAGAQVFPRDAALAAQWDDLAVQVQGLGMFPSDETLIHRIAETMALAWTVARGRQAGGGSSPVAAGLDARRRPVIHALRFRER